MDSKQMLMVLEHYCRKIAQTNDDIKVTRIANWKTMFVEQSGESGQAVMLSEYKVDGATYWAGFSSRSQTVYISLAG